MGDNYRDARLFANVDRFFHRFHHIVRLATDMGSVAAAVFAHNLSQLHQLLFAGIDGGGVDQAGGHAQVAAFHGLAHPGFHFFQLLWSRLSVAVAHHPAPHIALADVKGDVVSQLHLRNRLHERMEIVAGFFQPFPMLRGQPVCFPLHHGGGRRAALAGDFRGDALLQIVVGVGAHQNAVVGMAVVINKARGDDFAGGVDNPTGFLLDRRSDFGDFAVFQRHVRPIAKGAGAVDDCPALDDDIVHNKNSSFAGCRRPGNRPICGLFHYTTFFRPILWGKIADFLG